MFSGFENEKKESGTTGGETKPAKEQKGKEIFQPSGGYMAKVLVGGLKDPSLAIQKKILKELGNDGDDEI